MPSRNVTASNGPPDMERTTKIAYDVARSALRMSGDKEVHIVCLEQRSEMPADDVEIREGDALKTLAIDPRLQCSRGVTRGKTTVA